MPGKVPRLNPLQLRKELLVAESDLNRVQLIGEWQAMTDGVRTVTTRVKSVGSIASAAALFISGVSAFRRNRAASNGKNASWLQKAVQATKVVSSIWLAFRSREHETKEGRMRSE